MPRTMPSATETARRSTENPRVHSRANSLVDHDVEALLNSVRHRLRLVLVLDRLERLLPGAMIAALVIVALSRVVVAPWLLPVAGVIIVTAIVISVVQGLRVGLSDRTVAEVTDHQVGSRDALATAIEFADLGGPFGDQIRARARTLARNTRPDDITRVSPSRRRWAVVVLAAIALACMLLFTAAKVHVPTEDELAAEAFKTDAEQLRQQADDLLAVDPSPDNVTLAQQLNALAKELDQTKGLEDGLQKLDHARSELDASIGDNFPSQQAAVQGLEQSIQNNPLSAEGGSVADQMRALAQQLDTLSEQQRAELAQRLDALAASQTAGNPEVAAALSNAAASLANGDVSGAASALSAASTSQSSAAQSVADQSARSKASESLGAAAAHAKQAANGKGTGKGAGKGSAPNASGGSPSGQVKGALDGTGRGKGGVGKPNGSGTSTANSVNDTATIWMPGGESEKLNPSGTDLGGEETTVGKGQVASSSGGAQVPIADVIADYQQQATDAIDRDQIPPSSRELVQRYFDGLAGNGS